MFDPQLPGFLGHVFVDALAEFAFTGDAIETLHFSPEFHTHYRVRAGLAGTRPRRLRRTTTLIREIRLRSKQPTPKVRVSQYSTARKIPRTRRRGPRAWPRTPGRE